MDTFTLEAAPLTKSKNFVLADEDPKYYKVDLGFNPRKQWEEPLPVAKYTDPVPTVSDQYINMALEIHHSQVKYLHSLGVDACKEYSHQRVDYILEAVVAGDLTCKVCGDVQKSTQSRGHTSGLDTWKALHMNVLPATSSLEIILLSQPTRKSMTPRQRSFPAQRITVTSVTPARAG